ncbi:MAG: substrate-binding domain-containing protein [Lachnospiraceae bacterium]|nr:substrate-binding domain-containing protein [Lachnospiraceae bacterium]
MRRSKRNISILLLLLFIMCMSAGCEKKEPAAVISSEKEEDKLSIGMSFDSFVIERWARDRDIFVQAAKEMGAEVNVQNANGEVETQREQISYFIQKKMDVIVIVCIDSDALADVIKNAKDAGIKVIAYDRLINNADIDLYISFDNEMVGTLMGESLADILPEGSKVIMAGGSPLDNNVPMVENAFERVMKANKIEILDRMHCDGWRAELASDYIYSNRDKVAECDAIMCGNDNVASQVVNALAVQRMAGKIPVTGQDADLEACQRIVEGTQIMTVYKPVEKLAHRAAECAVAMAKGGEIAGGDMGMINNGKKDVPFVKLQPVMVTKDNMDEVIIESGFHSKDEVYLNIK